MTDHPLAETKAAGMPLTPAEASLHNNFLVSVKALRKDLVRTVYYLLQIKECRIYRKLGYGSMAEYGAQTAGLTGKQVTEFLTIARRLPRFPEVEAALTEGRLSWSQAQLIATKAEPSDQGQWISAAQNLSVRQMREMPALSEKASAAPESAPAEAANPGSPPVRTRTGPPRKAAIPPPKAPQRKPPHPSDIKHHVTLVFAGEDYAEFCRLVESAQTASGNAREDIIIDALRGQAAHPGGANGPRYSLVIMQCPTCGEAALPTPRGEVAASPPLLAAAACDAVIEAADGRRRSVIPPRIRRAVLRRARYACEYPGCTNTGFLEIHHRVPAAQGGTDDPGNLISLCARCHRRLHEDERAAVAALRHDPAR
ncbi:MAG: HNH endonuclease signature motif containing protein [bacterium]